MVVFILLYIICAVACGFTAMCYAEFASRVPISGSAYTYAYVSFGELIAWIIGWALILEYAIGNIVVAISWSSYLNNLLLGLGIEIPFWMTTNAEDAHKAYETARQLVLSGGEGDVAGAQKIIAGFQNAPASRPATGWPACAGSAPAPSTRCDHGGRAAAPTGWPRHRRRWPARP